MQISSATLYSLGGLIYLLYVVVLTREGSDALISFENAFSNHHGLTRFALALTFFGGLAVLLVLWPFVLLLRILKNLLKKI